MSEFKFACPVCGQHITADSSASGGQLDCPTCFRRIVVPQAPAIGDTKLILSASQAARPRHTLAAATETKTPAGRTRRPIWLSLGLFALLCAGAAALGLVGKKAIELMNKGKPQVAEAGDQPMAEEMAEALAGKVAWTLDPKKAVIPEELAAGKIHGATFVCEKAILDGGLLSLRQGRGQRPYLRLGVLLYAQRPTDLSGKSIEVTPGRKPPLPRILLKWKDEQLHPVLHEFTSGYALKLSFGQPADGRMPGKIYVGLPDESQSVVAGTFEAQIRTPPLETAEATPPDRRPPRR